MATVILSELSEKDLIDIEHYITDELCNPLAAMRIVKGIFGKMSDIAEFPRSAPLVFDVDSSKNEVRMTHFENYNIIYQYDYNEQIVSIARILNEKVDWKNKLSI